MQSVNNSGSKDRNTHSKFKDENQECDDIIVYESCDDYDFCCHQPKIVTNVIKKHDKSHLYTVQKIWIMLPLHLKELLINI